MTFHPALPFYFKAGGASVEFDAAPGPATFARLGLWDDRPYLLIVPGEIVDLPPEQRRALNEQTNPTWPHVHARLHCDYEEFVDAFPCNHILATAGDAVWERYRAWGQDRLAEFRVELRRIGERGAVRQRQLYGPDEARRSQSRDFGP